MNGLRYAAGRSCWRIRARCRAVNRRAVGHGDVLAGQAPPGCVRGIELFNLFDLGQPAQAFEVTDQFDLAEVAGQQRVGLTAATQGQAGDRPGPISGIASRRLSPAGSAGSTGPRRPRGQP